MSNDAFTAGIEPGGLRSKDEIRILLCYLLSSVGAPLTRDAILQSVQENGLANYFEVTDALEELTANGNLLLEESGYRASRQAQQIARQLDTALPYSVRTKALQAALRLLAQARRERENAVEIDSTGAGVRVTCHISGGPARDDLMTLALMVPDMQQAALVKRAFQQAPDRIYQVLLALLTGEPEVAAGFLQAEQTHRSKKQTEQQR